MPHAAHPGGGPHDGGAVQQPRRRRGPAPAAGQTQLGRPRAGGDQRGAAGEEGEQAQPEHGAAVPRVRRGPAHHPARAVSPQPVHHHPDPAQLQHRQDPRLLRRPGPAPGHAAGIGKESLLFSEYCVPRNVLDTFASGPAGERGGVQRRRDGGQRGHGHGGGRGGGLGRGRVGERDGGPGGGARQRGHGAQHRQQRVQHRVPAAGLGRPLHPAPLTAGSQEVNYASF